MVTKILTPKNQEKNVSMLTAQGDKFHKNLNFYENKNYLGQHKSD